MKITDCVKIAIVDDHPLFLEGLTAMVSQIGGPFDAASFASGTALLEALENGANPAVLISDLSMKPLNGLALLAALRSKGYNQPFILVSGVEEALSAADLAACGAFAFLPKSADLETFQEVIFSALNTNSTPGTSPRPHQRSRGQDNGDGFEMVNLTPRQVEIVEIIASGGSNRDVASQLNISENTVKTHLRQVFQILGVKRRTGCVGRARSLGLI